MNNHVIIGRQPNIIDIGRYFFNLFYMSMWYSVTVPTLEFDYIKRNFATELKYNEMVTGLKRKLM